MGAVFLAVPGGHGLFLRCAARAARDAVSDELSDGRAAVRCARALVVAAFMGGGRRLRRGGVRARDAGLCRGDAGLFAVFLVRGAGLLRCGADGCDAHRLCDPEFYVLCSGSHRAAPAFYVRLRYALQPEQHHAVVCAARHAGAGAAAGRLPRCDGIVVKADVQGSVEAIKQSLLKLSNDEVVVKIIHGGVGAINESDVSLASASNAIIIGFNVRPDATAKETADREGVDIRLYRVIYNAIEDVEAAMKGMLDPVFEEKVLGHAEVRQTFKASGVGTIAGSYVLDGTFERDCQARIVRDGVVIYDGKLASLKRFKDDVKEVKAGYECGFVFERFNDVKEGDQVEAFKMVEVPR